MLVLSWFSAVLNPFTSPFHMLHLTLLNLLKYFHQLKVSEHTVCEISSISINIIHFVWFVKQSKVVSRAEADNWWNLQTALTEQRAEVMFYSLSTLQSKRRSVFCDCSVRKESPQCLLQLHGFLHFPVQLLCEETCDKELCFSFLLFVVLC